VLMTYKHLLFRMEPEEYIRVALVVPCLYRIDDRLTRLYDHSLGNQAVIIYIMRFSTIVVCKMLVQAQGKNSYFVGRHVVYDVIP
jgi:hypothetical protein